LYALCFVLQLHGHILQLDFQTTDLSVGVAFSHFGELEARHATEEGLFKLFLETMVNDSNHPDFAVGLNKLGISEHSVHNLFFMPLEESLQLATELVISPFVKAFNHIGILPMTIQN
jgi:hypothetical protein